MGLFRDGMQLNAKVVHSIEEDGSTHSMLNKQAIITLQGMAGKRLSNAHNFQNYTLL